MNRLNDRELEIIKDKEFLLTKVKAISKIESILKEVSQKLKIYLSESVLAYPDQSVFKTSKISKGENYLGFPYMVLDYPAIFSKKNIFAYRTMFWWGNFFSTTLQLEGEPLNYYRKTIAENINQLLDNEVYICVGQTPWHYHYGKDNYELLRSDHENHIEKCTFLKISKPFNLNEWENFPKSALSFFDLLITVLTKEYM